MKGSILVIGRVAVGFRESVGLQFGLNNFTLTYSDGNYVIVAIAGCEVAGVKDMFDKWKIDR